MDCSRCDGRAVITRRKRSLLYRTTDATSLCGRCFTQDVEERVRTAIESNRMLEPGDRVLLTVSGEKDSTVMMHLVDRYVKESGADVRLTVLTVDEGINDYRTRAAELVRRHAEERGIEFASRSYQDLYGMGLDQIDAQRESDGYRMCMYCCSLRGEVVKRFADELQATKLATGLNLNDAVEHALMCLLKGSIDGQSLPVYTPPGSKRTFISPIHSLTGLECGLYAHLNGIELMNEDCTYCAEHLRDDVSHSLNLLEDSNPGILEAFYRGYARLAGAEAGPDAGAEAGPDAGAEAGPDAGAEGTGRDDPARVAG